MQNKSRRLYRACPSRAGIGSWSKCPGSQRGLTQTMTDPVSPPDVGAPIGPKLGLESGRTLLAVDAPRIYPTLLGPLPPGARLVICQLVSAARQDPPDVLHMFVRDRVSLLRAMPSLLALMTPKNSAWLSWPIEQTLLHADLTPDYVRKVLRGTPLVETNYENLNEMWMGVRLVEPKSR